MTEALAALCRIARSVFGVAAASISIRDGEAQAIDFASEVATGEGDFAAWWAACPEAAKPLLVVEDALSDPLLSSCPLVTGRPGIRFVASRAFGPRAEGRLLLLDLVPRAVTATDRASLDDLVTLIDSLVDLDTRARSAEAGEAEFRRLTEASTDTIVRGSLDGVRSYISPAVRDLLGYEPEELVGRRASDIVHPDDLPALSAMMSEVREGRASQGACEMRQRHKNGSWVWLEAFLKVTYDAQTGLPDGYVTSVRGVDRRKAIEFELARRADHDDLTGLPNRKLFREHLVAAIAAIEREGARFALLWMDLDNFKDINDRFGHPAGDAVLVEAALRFTAAAGEADLVARIGGDEFVVILNLRAGGPTADRLASRLLDAMAPPFMISGDPIEVGLSIGIAHAPDDGRDADALLATADAALYRAKAAGRGTFR